MPSILNTAVATGPGLSSLAAATREVFSAEIWLAALPTLKFDQFSTKKTELGVQPGRTINLPKFSNIKRGGALSEGVRMKTRSMAMSQASIEVTEQGNAVGFSEFLLQTSFFDQLSAASLLLGRDMAVVLDIQLRDSIVGAAGASVVYAQGVGSRAALTSGMIYDTDCVARAVETLETHNSPKWGGDHYVCFVHPHQVAGLRRDGNWVNAALYAGSTQIYTGEVGRYLDVRFVQTTAMPNGANSAVDAETGDYVDIGYVNALHTGVSSNQVNVYQSVMFGEYAYGHATALPVELRDNGVTDFGREHALAWYAVWGSAALESQNIVVIETA